MNRRIRTKLEKLLSRAVSSDEISYYKELVLALAGNSEMIVTKEERVGADTIKVNYERFTTARNIILQADEIMKQMENKNG